MNPVTASTTLDYEANPLLTRDGYLRIPYTAGSTAEIPLLICVKCLRPTERREKSWFGTRGRTWRVIFGLCDECYMHINARRNRIVGWVMAIGVIPCGLLAVPVFRHEKLPMALTCLFLLLACCGVFAAVIAMWMESALWSRSAKGMVDVRFANPAFTSLYLDEMQRLGREGPGQ